MTFAMVWLPLLGNEMPVPILVSGPNPLHQKLKPGITPNRHQHGIEPESCRVASMPIDRLVKPSEGTVQLGRNMVTFEFSAE